MPRKPTPKESIVLFYPRSIRINDLQRDVSIEYKGRIANLNFFLFLHILSEPYLDLSDTDCQGYKQIHSSILECLFRDHYAQVIEELSKYEYIQINPAYSNALHLCKSYRIHPQRLSDGQGFGKIVEKVNGHFRRKLNTLRKANFCWQRTDIERQHIIEQTANLILEPSDEALAYVAARYAKLGNPNPPEYYFEYFNYSVLKSAGVDAFGNRVHSIITNMPKVLRRCLRFKDYPSVPLVELDIVNSQPFFLSSVTGALLTRFVPEAVAALPAYSRWEQQPDFIEFRNLCRSGEIYEQLQDAFSQKFQRPISASQDAKERRDFTKKLTYGALFGSYALKDAQQDKLSKKYLVQTKREFYKIYKERFPSVYGLFKEVKSLFLDCTINKKGEHKKHANNCLIAQRLESGVIYSQVIRACLDHGITEVVTVHDCLIVRQDEATKVKGIMQYAFQQLNLYPKFS